MIDLIIAAAADDPDVEAVRSSECSLSYADLLADSCRVAGGLRATGVSRIAVLEPDAAHLLRVLAGAALAGVEPCLYQPDLPAEEFLADVVALGQEAVVTRRTDLDGSVPLLDPDQLLTSAPLPARVDPAMPQPLIVRTTGSTGKPKAVRHDWRVLARTVSEVPAHAGERWLLAYGPQQFAGIQVLQHVAAVHGTLVAPFPRQPADGAAAMLTDRVDSLSATPTYWRFLLAELRSRGVSAPPLTQITLGGEAAPDDLLDLLRRTFPQARITHVYASTEFGSVAAITDGRAGFPSERLWSEANPEATLKVVDGELWVRARAGMQGYLDGADVDDAEWRPTSDLVEATADRVFFRGRTTEVINVGGVKVSPLPVEERINELDGVAMVRVYGRPNPLTGAIVAAEVAPVADLDESGLADLRARIRTAVADLPSAWRPRSITFVPQIETLGGKLVRRSDQ